MAPTLTLLLPDCCGCHRRRLRRPPFLISSGWSRASRAEWPSQWTNSASIHSQRQRPQRRPLPRLYRQTRISLRVTTGGQALWHGLVWRKAQAVVPQWPPPRVHQRRRRASVNALLPLQEQPVRAVRGQAQGRGQAQALRSRFASHVRTRPAVPLFFRLIAQSLWVARTAFSPHAWSRPCAAAPATAPAYLHPGRPEAATGGWQNVLYSYAQQPDKHAEWVWWQDEHVVVIYDGCACRLHAPVATCRFAPLEALNFRGHLARLLSSSGLTHTHAPRAPPVRFGASCVLATPVAALRVQFPRPDSICSCCPETANRKASPCWSAGTCLCCVTCKTLPVGPRSRCVVARRPRFHFERGCTPCPA